MRKQAGFALGTLVAAPLLLLGTAAHASAAVPSTCTHLSGGTACFQPDGDFFSATDNAEYDGVNVRAYWSTSDGLQDSCTNYLDRGRITCNEDLIEGVGVRLRVALVRNGTVIAISDPPARATS